MKREICIYFSKYILQTFWSLITQEQSIMKEKI